MNFRYVAAISFLAMVGGCNLPPPHAAFQQAASFEPASVENVALTIVASDGRRAAGETSIAKPEFVGALMSRGYTPIDEGAAGGHGAIRLRVSIDQPETTSESREGTVTTFQGKRRQQRTVYTTYYIAQTSVQAQLIDEAGAVVWSSTHTSTCESEQGPRAAQQAAIQTAAGMVSASLPYRRLPLDKNSRPYDPRVQRP
jgi:hypothetical protein